MRSGKSASRCRHMVGGIFKVTVKETPLPRNPLSPTLPATCAQGIPSVPGMCNNNTDSRNFGLPRSHSGRGTRSPSFTPPWEAG